MAFLSTINAPLSPLWKKFICRFYERFEQHVNVAFNIDEGVASEASFYQWEHKRRLTDCRVMCAVSVTWQFNDLLVNAVRKT